MHTCPMTMTHGPLFSSCLSTPRGRLRSAPRPPFLLSHSFLLGQSTFLLTETCAPPRPGGGESLPWNVRISGGFGRFCRVPGSPNTALLSPLQRWANPQRTPPPISLQDLFPPGNHLPGLFRGIRCELSLSWKVSPSSLPGAVGQFRPHCGQADHGQQVRFVDGQ